MRRMRHVIGVAVLSFAVLCGAATTSQAAEEEKPLYVGVYGGYSFPDHAQNLEGRGNLAGVSFSDAAMKNGWSGGIKLGWVLPPLSHERWFNWEFEYWYQNMHLNQQNIIASIPGLGSGQVTLSGANLNVHTLASNFIIRRPTGIFQPYAGVGPSIVFVQMDGSPTTSQSLGVGSTSAPAFGINVLVGTRIMFSKTLGVFAEYKRNWAFNLAFDGFRSNLYSNAIVGGLNWDFDYISLP